VLGSRLKGPAPAQSARHSMAQADVERMEIYIPLLPGASVYAGPSIHPGAGD
jgi:hypothetical protein